jgi:hypothetical protein
MSKVNKSKSKKSKRLTADEVEKVQNILWEQQNQFQPITESSEIILSCNMRYTVADAIYWLSKDKKCLWRFLPDTAANNCMSLIFVPLIHTLVLKYGKSEFYHGP